MAPFVFLPSHAALIATAVLVGAALFGVGMFKRRLAGQALGRSGLEFLIVAVIATAMGYAIGLLLERIAGLSLPTGWTCNCGCCGGPAAGGAERSSDAQ